MSFQTFLKGWLGEQGTNVMQKFLLDSKIYHSFYDILIEGDERKTQIDHVIVSKFGVFIIETKNWSGWIYRKEDEDYWTQSFPGERRRIQNPLKQNKLHTQIIAAFCKIKPSNIFSIIIFWGDCEFKTLMPQNVIKWSEYPSYIKSKKRELMSDAEVERICSKLKPGGWHIPIVTNIMNANVIKAQNKSALLKHRDSSSVTQTGYCVRCGTGIQFNCKRPLCSDCYDEWARWGNPDYEENYCHECCEEAVTSMKRPLCHQCYQESNRR